MYWKLVTLVAMVVVLAQLTVAQQSSDLKIVVLEGEGGVNIVRQKTAVVPLVEVRDRNDQPVAGAVVRFAISNGRASFSGARTLTVTTNAAGRAAATGLTPTGSGALQISASAAYQGQTTAIAIAQTNVTTAAQAAAATSGSGGATSGGGAGAAGGSGGGTSAGSGAAAGGGLSGTTLGIVGGAIAGGVIAAKKFSTRRV